MKKYLLLFSLLIFVMACSNNKEVIEKDWHEKVKRVGMVVKIKKEMVDEYKKLHADNNPGVRHLLKKYHMRNFSIFLVQLADGEWYEFGYYEYWGDDLEGDLAKMDAEPENIKWLEICDPMQEGVFPGQESWKKMERIYFNY